MAERYFVQFTSSGARDFRRLPLDVRRQITSAVDNLSANPRPSVFVRFRDMSGIIGFALVDIASSMRLMTPQD